MTHRSGNLSKVFAKSGTDREEPLPLSTTTPPKPPASLGAVWGYGHRPIINHLTHTLWIRMMTICWVTINHLNTHRMRIIGYAEFLLAFFANYQYLTPRKATYIWRKKMTFTIIYHVNVKIWECHCFTLSTQPYLLPCQVFANIHGNTRTCVRDFLRKLFPPMSLE